MTTLSLQALSATSIASSLQISEPFLVIAGYTGRNADAVNQHSIELQAHGITPPEMIPMFWTLPNWLLSVAQPVIQVHAGKSSGEAEPVLIRMPNGELFVTVGSDHTDRSLEGSSMLLAKLTCPKVLAPMVWRFEDVAERWDSLHLQAFVGDDEICYQDGALALIRHPLEVLEQASRSPFPVDRPFILFLGTIPLLTGSFCFAKRFLAILEDRERGRNLRCDYAIDDLSSMALG
jgi:Protein of unknown function (DUF2848)